MQFPSVDFPLPVLPTIPIFCPGKISKLSFDNTDEQATQLSRKEFTRIDGALANIFNNLIIKV